MTRFYSLLKVSVISGADHISLNLQVNLRMPFYHMIGFPTKYKLFYEAIEAANKIRMLAILAYNSGARIKWFEYSNHKKATGGKSFLKPVNASELVLMKRKKIKALDYLSLSKANRESLVFWSPASEAASSVLFSG